MLSVNIPTQNRFKILIVDDAPINRMLLSEILAERYDLVEAEDGAQAVSILEQNARDFALVLLDIVMPEMDGFGVLAYMNKNHWIDDLPVIMISSETTPANIRRAYELGVSDFMGRPFDTEIVRQRVNNTILLYAKQRRLAGIVTEQVYEKEKTKNLMISILSHIVESRNGESGLHVLHITTITQLLLKQLAQKTDGYMLTEDTISLISSAAALHDIGKITIPDEILNKPGRLTDEEFEIIKTHPLNGAKALTNLPVHADEPLVRAAYAICRWHHERYDGTGYPDGLRGDDIPISAQVVALADAYDALTSDRCYKEAYSHETALQMILDGRCGTFNPLLLECLKEVHNRLPKALADVSLSRHSVDRDTVRRELSRQDVTSATARQLRLIQIEREKFRFLMDAIPEIVFSYSRDSDIFSTSPIGAEALGLREVISDPAANRDFCRVFGGDFLHRLMARADETTAQAPAFTLPGNPSALCKAIWLEGEPRCCGVIGKIGKLPRT